MSLSPNDPRFKEIIDSKNVKKVFEKTALFYELYMTREHIFTGFWSGETWHYDDPTIEEYFSAFSEGYISGIIEYYITSEDEKHSAEKRMKAQIHEIPRDDEIILDISQYLK
jgi:hypothetical protein